MRYISDDGKVFNTEQECLEHENLKRKMLEEERIKKERLEKERANRIEAINKKYEELQKLISEYGKDYDIREEFHFVPAYELMNMLYI